MGCGARGLQTFTVNDPSVFLFIHQRPDRSTRCEFSPNCICQSAFFLSVCGIFLSFSFFFFTSTAIQGPSSLFLALLFCSWISPVQSEIFEGIQREIFYMVCVSGRSHNVLSSGYLCFGLWSRKLEMSSGWCGLLMCGWGPKVIPANRKVLGIWVGCNMGQEGGLRWGPIRFA